MKIQLVKGTHDIFGQEMIYYQYIANALSALVEKYNYSKFDTPILEHASLFQRKNDSSDIVRKQMYIFNDLKNRPLTLRPECTPGVVRCLVNNNLNYDYPIKAYYLGPVFRYENPKYGTYRQFIQFGVENIGLNNVYVDIETILLSYKLLQQIKLNNLILKINSLGDLESREKYIQALKKFFAQFIQNMCDDCQERFKINPLRILDCKDLKDQKIIQNAPKITDYLNSESKNRFEKTKQMLAKLNIPYEIDENLVRGLDYYSHIVFEYQYINNKKINIGAICGGGHYDNLVSELGGPKISGVGFAFGIERIFNILKEENTLPKIDDNFDFIIMPINENNIEYCFFLNEKLKKLNYKTEVFFEKKSLKSMFHTIEKKNGKYAVIVGDNEIKNQEVIIKNMKSRKETKILIQDLEKKLIQLIKHEN